MPGGDGTGPGGMGPMTGRAAGYCAGYPMPGYMNPVFGRGYGFGRGFGFGRGGGRGRRNRFYATGLTGWQRAAYGYPTAPYGWGVPNYGVPYGVPAVPAAPTKEQELDMLKGQSEYLEDALEEINKRIKELGTEKK
jgi:hypothetical protein